MTLWGLARVWRQPQVASTFLFSLHYGLILITLNLFLLIRFTVKHTLTFSKVRAVPSMEFFLNSGYRLNLKALPCNYTVTLTKKIKLLVMPCKMHERGVQAALLASERLDILKHFD